jgi:hypothetical protein
MVDRLTTDDKALTRRSQSVFKRWQFGRVHGIKNATSFAFITLQAARQFRFTNTAGRKDFQYRKLGCSIGGHGHFQTTGGFCFWQSMAIAYLRELLDVVMVLVPWFGFIFSRSASVNATTFPAVVVNEV